jgi:hypothetical protein
MPHDPANDAQKARELEARVKELSGKRPGKCPAVPCASGAGDAQAADCAIGAAAAPTWNLAKAAGVSPGAVLLVAVGRRAKSQIR